jgi:hypothetical protein
VCVPYKYCQAHRIQHWEIETENTVPPVEGCAGPRLFSMACCNSCSSFSCRLVAGATRTGTSLWPSLPRAGCDASAFSASSSARACSDASQPTLTASSIVWHVTGASLRNICLETPTLRREYRSLVASANGWRYPSAQIACCLGQEGHRTRLAKASQH